MFGLLKSKAAPAVNLAPTIRWGMRGSDLGRILEIDGDTHELAWTAEDYCACVRQKDAFVLVADMAPCCNGYPGKAPDVAAFVLGQAYGSRVVIARLGVAPAWQRDALGTLLIEHIANWQREATALEYVVSERDLPRQLFLQWLGFVARTTVRNQFGRDHDGYQFRLEI